MANWPCTSSMSCFAHCSPTKTGVLCWGSISGTIVVFHHLKHRKKNCGEIQIDQQEKTSQHFLIFLGKKVYRRKKDTCLVLLLCVSPTLPLRKSTVFWDLSPYKFSWPVSTRFLETRFVRPPGAPRISVCWSLPDRNSTSRVGPAIPTIVLKYQDQTKYLK